MRGYRIIVMIGWVIFLVHGFIWAMVLLPESTIEYHSYNHDIYATFYYLHDHESYVLLNLFIALSILFPATLAVYLMSKHFSRKRWTKLEYALMLLIVLFFGCWLTTHLIMWAKVSDLRSKNELFYSRPPLGARIYELRDIDSDHFVVLFDSIRESLKESTQYYKNNSIYNIDDSQEKEDTVVNWYYRHHFCDIYLPDNKVVVNVFVYKATEREPLEISIYNTYKSLTNKEALEFESLTLDKICHYQRCELRRHKESFYSYMYDYYLLFFIGAIGYGIIALLVVLVLRKIRLDQNLPPHLLK
ncbi:MAG: hypothetical protein IJ835_06970 [Muribaculaceae bacterium]|nr:hypothetical protein [Muribaculaceae bacterium]